MSVEREMVERLTRIETLMIQFLRVRGDRLTRAEMCNRLSVTSNTLTARVRRREVPTPGKPRASGLDPSMSKDARESFVAGKPFADICAAAMAIPLHEQQHVSQVRMVFTLQRLSTVAIEVHARMAAEMDTSLGVFLIARGPFALDLEGLEALQKSCQERMAELGQA